MVIAEGRLRRPACRRKEFLVVASFASFGLSEVLFQEFAEERMVELVTAPSGADKQSLFREACEVFRLESAREVMCRQLAVAVSREFVYQFKFFRAELRYIGAKFLAP